MTVADKPFAKAGGPASDVIRAKALFGDKFLFACLVAAVSAFLLYLVWVYQSALRDGNYFDGWLLAGAIGLQIWFHARRKVVTGSAQSNKRWLWIHIFTGYVIITLFLSHSNFALPDTLHEWAMWLCIMSVSLSGIFGTYLSWGAKAKLRGQDEISQERAKKRLAELAMAVRNLSRMEQENAPELPLPTTPYQAWLEDFYKFTLRPFFSGPQNFFSHMVGSQRHIKQMLEEIDGLDSYLNRDGREKLHAMKQLVLEKDRLDFALVQFKLSKIWLLVHLPLTYSLFVLAVLHVIIVYSFASGVW